MITVYVDVLFIINFIIDYLLLCITSFFIKRKPQILKIMLAASLGALYSAFVFFLPMGASLSLPLSLMSALFMVWIAFGFQRATLFFKRTCIFYLVSFVSAGAGMALLSFANQYDGVNFAVNAGIFYADINAYTLLFIFLASVFIIHIACGHAQKVHIGSQFLYEVTIQKGGKSATNIALFDTGNFLKDPITQKSVLIAEWHAISSLFKEDTLAEAVANAPALFLYIPCRGIGGESGIFAFLPDKITSPKIRFPESLYVGISERVLDHDGSYHMILPNTVNCLSRAERM